MIVKRNGGMTELIPSPQEKRAGLLQDHTLHLLDNLHKRIKRLELASSLSLGDAEEFSRVLKQMQKDEDRNLKLHFFLSGDP